MAKIKNLICAVTIATGLGLASHAFFQKDGEMDKEDKIEYIGGLGLAVVGLYALGYKKKNYN